MGGVSPTPFSAIRCSLSGLKPRKTPLFFERICILDDLQVYEISKLADPHVYFFQNSKFVPFCQIPFANFVHALVDEFALHQPAIRPH